MIYFVDLQRYFYQWAKLIDGGTIYWEQDNGPKECPPAISMRVMTIQQIGPSFYGPVDETTGEAKLFATTNLFLRLQAYGANAWGRLQKFEMSGRLYEEMDFLRENTSYSLLRSEAQNNITGLNDTRNEERWTTTLVFNGAVEIENIQVGVIEQVNGEYTYQGDTPVKTGTFKIETP